jgi:hypothetical protein
MRLRYDPFRQQFEHSREYDCLNSYERKVLLDHVKRWCRDWDGQRTREIALPLKPRVMVRPPSMPHRMVKMRRVEVILTEPVIPGRRENAEEKARRELMQFMAHANLMNPAQFLRPNKFAAMVGNDRPPRDFILPAAQQKAMADMKAYCVADVKMAQIALAPPVIDKPVQSAIGPLSRWDHGEDFIVALRKRGYEELGRGCFSAVLAKKNSRRVIKVNFRADPWLDYVVWAAKAGQAGKFAPKVFSYRRFNIGRGSEFYVAVMERLNGNAYELAHTNRPRHRAYLALTQFMRNRDDAKGVTAERELPGAITFAVLFRTAFQGKRFDLHEGNFMQREDGTLVCTDPLSDGTTTAPSRMRHRDLAALHAA